MSAEAFVTYRLQLRPGFGFAEAGEIVPYLAALGITHVYCSPVWQATPGSSHGYDVVDPAKINDEIGGTEGWRAFVRTLSAHGLKLLLDIVPNHMAIHATNPWWQDVLRHGEQSTFAAYFDVDWESSNGHRHNQVLLPVLGDHYGRILEAGELTVARDGQRFTLRYAEHRFPIDPVTQGNLLGKAADIAGSTTLAYLARAFENLSQMVARVSRQRDLAVLEDLLAGLLEDRGIVEAIDACIEKLNRDVDALDALIMRQHYRLASWRTARQELGYRRFFDIHSLAGLRTEDPAVFDAVHRFTFDLCKRHGIAGLRVDHPDGLRDPAGYFQRLQDELPAAWLLAEKILMPGESLPRDWPVAGTTGYEFMNLVGGLFIDPQGLADIDRFHRQFTGNETCFPDIVLESKRMIARQVLGSELNRLSELLARVCERHRRHRDYTRQELATAIVEIAACFPVYRGYVRAEAGGVSEADRQYVDTAIQRAAANQAAIDPELFRFIHGLLLLNVGGESESEFVMRFQQFTAPLMAKGLEDTALFRFNRLIACNDVGADPADYPRAPASFYHASEKRQREQPLSLLTTDTHDSKYSGDFRARLSVVSEMPQRWAKAVGEWSQRLRHGGRPDCEAEYLFYQVLVGAWPISEARVQAFMLKAAREAKRHTSWLQQDAGYEHALAEFVATAFADVAFMESIATFAALLVEPGYRNSLAQTLLKLTAPGTPDIYQGTETWRFSLVDPDNRREVDFEVRKKSLAMLDDETTVETILEQADKGLPKLWIIRQALRLRQQHPRAFGRDGDHESLSLQGTSAGHLVAFTRRKEVAVIVPRLAAALDDWRDTRVLLPEGEWRNCLTHERVDGSRVLVSELLARFPVALLVREENPT